MERLDNLVKVNKLQEEAPNQGEFDAMFSQASEWLSDATEKNAPLSRFLLAYEAAHGFARAALRWHGYRSNDRYIVFEVLDVTAGLETSECRVLASCHDVRNKTQYEGASAVSDQLVSELVEITAKLQGLVAAIGPVA
ncbi:MAG: hypothetical protein WD558_08065 [Pseudomonadales bacterium]